MAEWIGGLLSGLPAWLIVIILIVISIVIFIIGVILEFAMIGVDLGLPFKRRKK